jgi:hypothetical protein
LSKYGHGTRHGVVGLAAAHRPADMNERRNLLYLQVKYHGQGGTMWQRKFALGGRLWYIVMPFMPGPGSGNQTDGRGPRDGERKYQLLPDNRRIQTPDRDRSRKR